MKWTDKQIDAFSLDNREILVSAAAGSGKTAVMVERILRLITDEENCTDIDRLLVVTFTKKAAESMREKIRKELEKRLSANPDNEHLQRQMLLINHAHISTIDSFCSFIVRNYFYLTDDVSSNYRIGDDSELKLIEADVLSRVLEDEYKTENPVFLEFVDYFATGKNDMPLEEIIMSLYQYSQSHENPKAWLSSCEEVYVNFENDISFIEQTVKSLINENLREAIKVSEYALSVCDDTYGPFMYRANFESDIDLLEAINKEEDIYQVFNLLKNLKFSRLSGKKGDGVSDELKDYCKELRKQVKKSVDELKDTFAYADFDVIVADIQRCISPVKELIRIVIRYSGELLKEKKDRNIYGHADISHIALDILKDKDGALSPARLQLHQLFDEIFIDEYQDSNRLQEEILYNLTSFVENEPKRVFMVGDVKQSIYSFRMACPDLFIHKLNTFTETDSKQQKVFLSHNFRSRKQVTDTVNFVFNRLMNESISGIRYDHTQRLQYAANYEPQEEQCYKTEVLHMALDDDDINKYEAEAYMIGDKIRSLIDGDEPMYITDRHEGIRRRLRYSDIAIIVRNQKDVVNPIRKVLMDEFGIPVSSTSNEDFFSSYEINLVLNYLKILDNPLQDFPLCAVLMSPIAGLSASELAKIRLESGKSLLFDCLNTVSESENISHETKEKINSFFDCYNRLRKMVPFTSLHNLIWEFYEQSGTEAFMAALPGGKKRLENLNKLINKAVSFENNGYRGLFEFLRYIERLIELDIKSEESESTSPDSDSVTIMTMHKSKGLEFPVCIVAGLSKKFNMTDERASVLLHQNLGIGLNSVDVVRRTSTKTIFKRLISKQKHIEKYGEEIRILYVAMTRAEEKLILCCCHKEKENISDHGYFGRFDILKGSSYWSWLKNLIDVNSGLFMEKEYTFSNLERINEYNKSLRLSESSHKSEFVIDENEDDILEGPKFVYTGQAEDDLNKVSVTVLKQAYLDLQDEGGMLESANLIEIEPEYPIIPKFLQESKGLTGAQRGTIYHSLLEHWDYALPVNRQSIDKFVLELYSKKIFTKEEYSVIDSDKIISFLNSELGMRMKHAFDNGKLKREQSFSVILRKTEEEFNFIESDSLMQGIIDAYFVENDEIVIVDYKTDVIKENDVTVLADKYAMQLKCYKYALEKLTGIRVKEIWIYSLFSDKCIKIDS